MHDTTRTTTPAVPTFDNTLTPEGLPTPAELYARTVASNDNALDAAWRAKVLGCALSDHALTTNGMFYDFDLSPDPLLSYVLEAHRAVMLAAKDEEPSASDVFELAYNLGASAGRLIGRLEGGRL